MNRMVRSTPAMLPLLSILFLFSASTLYVNSFQSSSTFLNFSNSKRLIQQRNKYKHRRLHVALIPPDDVDNFFFLTPKSDAGSDSKPSSAASYAFTKEECNPIIRIGNDGEKEKVINLFGLWCLVVSIVTGPIWMMAMMVTSKLYDVFPNWDTHRSIYDKTGKIWARAWLTCTNSYPSISGNMQSIQDSTSQPCLFVSNHASWLDIPILCTVLDPVFKFIAKGELRKVPCIGQQLDGGQHILIDRDDRKSQLRTFKDGIAWLQKGVPIMAFPEGMRSSDGRLMEFKKGLFSLAVKANVPIVPITLCHTNAIMPTYSYFPVQSGAGKIHVHIGSPIYPDGKTESELETLVRQEFLTHLPTCQHSSFVNDGNVRGTANDTAGTAAIERSRN